MLNSYSSFTHFDNPNIETGIDIDLPKNTGLGWPENTSEKIIQINPVTPKETNTTSKSRLYRFPYRVESETSQSPTIYQMYLEFHEIITFQSFDADMEETSPFITATKIWLEKYGVEALELIKMYLHSALPTSPIISEIMSMLGDVSNQASHEERREMLEIGIQSDLPEMRYGASLGLANMKSLESIPLLQKILSKEKIPMIANTVKEILQLLKNEK